jgi:hypothetical protein
MPILRIVTTGFIFGQLNQNRMHFVVDDPTVTLTDAAIDIRDNWLNNFKQALAVEFHWTEISVSQLGPLPPAPVTLVVAIDGTGGSVPGNVMAQALVMKIGTAVPGRKGRGRIFIGGTGNNVTIFGLLFGADYAFYNNMWTPMRARYLADGSGPLELGLVTGNDPSTFRSAISLVLSPYPGLQSRRRVGHGA